MKIRNGFVSNSSSSSFILVGIKLDDSLSKEELARKYITEEAINEYIKGTTDGVEKFSGEDKEGWWKDLWYECAWDGDFVHKDMSFIDDDNNSFIGKILTDGDELDDGELSLSEINEIVENLGLEGDCKIYFGTRPC